MLEALKLYLTTVLDVHVWVIITILVWGLFVGFALGRWT